ncbi:MAG: Csp1 family four helix bundle copper storage protein [Pseudomonadota bacterium]|nr:Csp1 family four helix bundle copper storage protein [Pseudomonadota bacterium]
MSESVGDSHQMAGLSDGAGELDVSRRHALMLMGALAALGGMPAMARAETGEHHAHGMAGDTPGSVLVAAASHCVAVGNACLAHIFQTLKTGDTTLAQCGILVDNTIAVCEAAAKLTLNASPHAKAMASVCQKECEDCAMECRKHAQAHPICADMAQACEATVAAVRKFVA